MVKLCQYIKDNYIEYKTENDKMKELKNILNYLFKLDYYYINSESYYETYYNKKNTLYIEIKNINKLNNNITKICFYNIEYLNNLPLKLKWLSISTKVNCNLSPNIIYLECSYCDIHNLPKSLIFLVTSTYIHNKIILNNNTIKKYITKIFYDYLNIIFNINFMINYSYLKWNNYYFNIFYILK